MTISNDGSKLAATGGAQSTSGYIYTSVDYGNNWTERTLLGSKNWTSISSSSDGSVLVATVYNGYVYISYDYGENWSAITSLGSKYWQSSSISNDGLKIFVVNYGGSGGYVYKSIDSGVNWIQIPSFASTNSLLFVNASSDGSSLVVLDSNKQLYTSFDSGQTWSNHPTVNGRNITWAKITNDNKRIFLTINDARLNNNDSNFLIYK